MNEVPTLVTSCVNCIAPGSLSAMLALILIGAWFALTAERRKLARPHKEKPPEGGSQFIPVIVDQANRNAGLDFRR
jgi:hypothetical protein